jgi:F-type H+-transporting ATPase subunit epsilon
MPLQVSVVTPEREVYSGEATFVVARAANGDVGILPSMAPFLSAVHHRRLVIEDEDGQTYIAVHGGFLEVFHDKVTVLTQVAEVADEIDLERARRQREEAEAAMQRGEDSPEIRDALLRAINRLDTAAESGVLDIG